MVRAKAKTASTAKSAKAKAHTKSQPKAKGKGKVVAVVEEVIADVAVGLHDDDFEFPVGFRTPPRKDAKAKGFIAKAKGGGDDIGASFAVLKAPQTAGGKASSSSSSSSSRSSIKASTAPQQASDSAFMWYDKHAPRTSAECVVHPGKYRDVSDLLKRAIAARGAQLIVLSGPAGTGKTTVLKLCAAEQGVHVHEWINPIDENLFSKSFCDPKSSWKPNGDTAFDYVPVLAKFEQFLAQLRHHMSVVVSTLADEQPPKKSIVLIEDAPNLSQSTQALFHAAIRRYLCTSPAPPPLVFIVSTLQEGHVDLSDLIPRDLLSSPNTTTQIKFNEVAPTLVTKAVKRVVGLEKTGANRLMPTQTDMNNIVESCNGDIRTALNSLQMVMMKPTRPLQTPMAGAQDVAALPFSLIEKYSDLIAHDALRDVDPSENAKFSASLGRDSSTQLLHVIGKVLWGKRLAPIEGDAHTRNNMLPPHLLQHKRPPLKSNPDAMRDLTGLSAGRFHAWLQHNYLSVFDDLDDVIAASEALSLVDSMDGDWTVRSTMDDVSSSIACRSLMFSHKHVSSRTTMGFRRPELFNVQTETAESMRSGQHLSTALVAAGESCGYLGLTDLVQDFLPFRHQLLSKVRLGPSLNGWQGTIQQLGRFKGLPAHKNAATRSSAFLDEQTVGDADKDDLDVPASLPFTESTSSSYVEKPEEDDDEIIDTDITTQLSRVICHL